MQYILTEKELKNMVPIEQVIQREKIIVFLFERAKPAYCENNSYYCDDCNLSPLNNNFNDITIPVCRGIQRYSK